MENEEHFHTIVIGGGQAGLAAAYYLSRLGVDFVVLEGQARLGEPWRKRWDSLRLFTPSKFNGLPGMPFPRADFYFPSKDEVGQYIQDYAERFNLPVRLNATVNSLSQSDGQSEYLPDKQRYCGHRCIPAASHPFIRTRTQPGDCPVALQWIPKPGTNPRWQRARRGGRQLGI